MREAGNSFTAYTSHGLPCATFRFEQPVRKCCVEQTEKGSFLILGINPSNTIEYIYIGKQASVDRSYISLDKFSAC
jgi:hypothetical protein